MKYLIFLAFTAFATISCNNATDNTENNGSDTTMNTPDHVRNDLGADTSPMPVDTAQATDSTGGHGNVRQ